MKQRLEKKKAQKSIKKCKKEKQGLQLTAIAYSIKDHLVLSVLYIIHSIAQMNLNFRRIYITIKNYN